MAKPVRRVLIYTHRWLGIVCGVVFIVWFVSGIVLSLGGVVLSATTVSASWRRVRRSTSALRATVDKAVTSGLRF